MPKNGMLFDILFYFKTHISRIIGVGGRVRAIADHRLEIGRFVVDHIEGWERCQHAPRNFVGDKLQAVMAEWQIQKLDWTAAQDAPKFDPE